MSADFKILRPHVAKQHSAKQASASSRCEWSQPTCQLRPCQQQKRTRLIQICFKEYYDYYIWFCLGKIWPLPFLAESRETKARGKAGEPLCLGVGCLRGVKLAQQRQELVAGGCLSGHHAHLPHQHRVVNLADLAHGLGAIKQLWPKGENWAPNKVRTGNSPLTPEESHGGSGPGLALSHSPSLDSGKTWKNYFSHLLASYYMQFSYQN